MVITPEGRVLRHLRMKHDLSQRAVAEQLGYSNGFIAQIENGRINPPRGDKLLRFLKLYGDITAKYFQEMCKNWQDEKTDADIIREYLDHLSPENLKLLRMMVEQMGQKRV